MKTEVDLRTVFTRAESTEGDGRLGKVELLLLSAEEDSVRQINSLPDATARRLVSLLWLLLVEVLDENTSCSNNVFV